MEGTKKVERVFKGKRQTRWTQSHFVRLTDLESAMELEDAIEPSSRYAGDEQAVESPARGRTQSRRMGEKARETQRELQRLRQRSKSGDD